MTNAARTDLSAALYLQAVLPAMTELIRLSQRAKKVVAGWDCDIEFALRGGEATTLQFGKKETAFKNERDSKSKLSLLFLSSKQLVALFSGSGLSLPIPRRGWWRIGSWIKFARLGKILDAELEQHPAMLLGVALGSISPLLAMDAEAQSFMRDCPEGVAEFRVVGTDIAAWVEWRGQKIAWGREVSSKPVDVWIEFGDEATALGLLRGEADELAAIGLGKLKVRGLVPLAEALGAVMELAERYLDPK